METPGSSEAFFRAQASRPQESWKPRPPVDLARVGSSAERNGGIWILGPPRFDIVSNGPPVSYRDAVLAAIRSAQAPPRSTQKFLDGLGFANDRLFINMPKAFVIASLATGAGHTVGELEGGRLWGQGPRPFRAIFVRPESATSTTRSRTRGRLQTLVQFR